MRRQQQGMARRGGAPETARGGTAQGGADAAARRAADYTAAEMALVGLGERLLRTLGVARALLRHGRHVDMTGVEDAVGQFCARLLDLPPDRARPLLPLLHALSALVAELTQLMAAGR